MRQKKSKSAPRPEVTGDEILYRLTQVDEETREAVLDKISPAGNWSMPGVPILEAPPPLYPSWRDYIERTTSRERLTWCREKAKKANRKRLLSNVPQYKLSAAEVWEAMLLNRGRCTYCGSLAVEKKPFDPALRERTPWAPVGRRVGTLGHKTSRFHGGDNHPDNICWACMWCNTWVSERKRGATDHGGLYPADDGELPADAVIAPARKPTRLSEVEHEVEPNIWEMTGVEPGDGSYAVEYMMRRLFGPE